MKMKNLKGGAPRQKFFQQLWELKLNQDEVETHAMSHRIGTLEQELAETKEQNADILAQIQQMQSQKATLKAKLCNMSEKLKTDKHTGRGRSCNKSFEDYSESHKGRLKKAKTQSCQYSLFWLCREGYIPLTVEVKNTRTGENEKIDLRSEELIELFGSEEEVTEERLDMLNMILLIKDSYNISGGAYHELAAICKSLPRHYKIKQRIRKLNELWNIRPIPHGIGVQQSLEQRLHVRLEHLLKVSPHDTEFVKKQLVRVKLSRDGTNIWKRLHVVTFTFTLLEEGNKAHSSEGNHILAVFKEPEKYDSVKAALEDVSTLVT